jgi:pilus assembly protein CpaE
MREPKVTAATSADMQIAPVPRISIQAFCETQATASAINRAAMDRRMSKTHLKVNMGGAGAAMEAYRNSPTPNLIVLEGNGDKSLLLSQLDELSEFCDPGTKVIIIGPFNDIELYRELVSLGVSDYMHAPVDAIAFVASVSSAFAATKGKSLGKVIAVLGAKGGVGASTIAHNVAWGIASQYASPVVLVDFDQAFGTSGLNFNQDPPMTLTDVLSLGERLDAAGLDKILFKCSEMLSLIAAPAVLDRTYDPDETAFDPLLELLRESTPNIVLDLPHVWTGWLKSLVLGADEIILVTAPDLANLRNCKNILDIVRAARPNDALPKIIINMVGAPKRPEIDTKDFVNAIGIEHTATIVYDAKLFGTSANNGQMLAETDPSSKINETISVIVKSVMSKAEPVKPEKKKLLAPLSALFARAKGS